MQPDVYAIITNEIALGVLERFNNKGADYGDAWRLLGAKGQFSDINRKFWKLYNAIWLDQELVGEQPDECVEDIIGHCLLLLYILRYENSPERALFSSHETSTGAVLSDDIQYTRPEARPTAEQVVEAIRRGASDESRDGFSLTRIIDAVLAEYGRKEHGVE